MILSSDHIIDLGPFAGINGGKIIYEGSPSKIKDAKTLTADYLNDIKKIEVPKKIGKELVSLLSSMDVMEII